MALTRQIEFKTVLQKRNRIQVPRPIRWEFQLETTQTLHVLVHFEGNWRSHQKFYTQMNKDGRIKIPQVAGNLLKAAVGGQNIVGEVVEVELSPAALEADEEDD
jgi:hypothetical protein